MAGYDFTLVWLITVKYMVHNTVTVCICKKFGAITHKASWRDSEFNVSNTTFTSTHIDKLTFSWTELFHYGTDICVGNFDDKKLHRLMKLAVNHLCNNLRTGNLKFIILTAHCFDKDWKVEFTSARYLECIGAVCFFNTKSNICFNFLEKSVTKVTGGYILTLSACKRWVVYDKVHWNRRLVNLYERKRLNAIVWTDCFTDIDILNTAYANDVTKCCSVTFNSFKSFKLIELCNSYILSCTVCVTENGSLSVLCSTSFNTAYTDSADKLIRVNVWNKELESSVHITLRSRDFFYNCVKERFHIRTGFMIILWCIAVTGRRINYRELKLIFVGTEFDKEVENLVNNLFGSCTGTVDFVKNNKRLFAEAECLFKNKSCLRHTPLKCVNKQYNTVNHLENTLNLTAEIGMTWGVNNVNFDAVVHYGCRLWKDCDTSFTLKVIRVHYSFFYIFICSENTALLQKLVNQSSFAVVNMGDNCNIS